jgi:hypothetical protein
MNIGNNEVWRAINGYLNYEVSSHGRVRNSITGRILKPGTNGGGYYHVCLYKGSKKVTTKIHRLVCEEFNENKNNNNVVDHIDRNKLNNFYENLRWTTLEGNQKNRTISKNNTSGTAGVVKDRNSWRAHWTQDGKTHSKNFINKEDAINYRKEMEALHGYL